MAFDPPAISNTNRVVQGGCFRPLQFKMSTASATADLTTPSGVLSPISIFYTLLVPVFILWYAYWKISRKHMVELAEKIPGPTTLPIIGNALEFVGSSPVAHCEDGIFKHLSTLQHFKNTWISHKIGIIEMISLDPLAEFEHKS
ncbi:hypothetical protein NQ317_017442 [Molorchus minor]|uniref:Cytochrome P450 n=1 Tax=Molorchus minor TaxID=1323400 RepID=A0ABQ9JAR8_9CUCU|nr:hypothetical protein NQ317_017442 [Molorchus minor]